MGPYGEPRKQVTTLTFSSWAALAAVFMPWTAQARMASGLALDGVGDEVVQAGVVLVAHALAHQVGGDGADDHAVALQGLLERAR